MHVLRILFEQCRGAREQDVTIWAQQLGIDEQATHKYIKYLQGWLSEASPVASRETMPVNDDSDSFMQDTTYLPTPPELESSDTRDSFSPEHGFPSIMATRSDPVQSQPEFQQLQSMFLQSSGMVSPSQSSSNSWHIDVSCTSIRIGDYGCNYRFTVSAKFGP